MNDFEKIVEFNPAFDRRSEGYGIHCVELRMILKKDNKAVHFLLYTGWYLNESNDIFPMPADLGYHSPVETYEEQKPISGECRYIEGPCYYDGSVLNAEPIFQALKKKGSDGVWEELEKYYISIFGDKE